MRVPTYATYLNMTNATIANKNLVDLYSFQSITGLKAQNYSGYGMSASSIVLWKRRSALPARLWKTIKLPKSKSKR